MDRKRAGGDMPARKFAYSWADEVEREEEEEQQQRKQNAQQPPREEEEEKKERAKGGPFGAARPREVVLAEKGVDWRVRDRELDASHRRTREQANRDVTAGPGRTTPRRRHAGSTPMGHREVKALPVGYSDAWGGKRKCAGEVPARQGRPAADQGRRVFGELNLGCSGNSSHRSSRKSCNSAGSEGVKAAAGGESRDSSRGMKSDDSGGGDITKGKERNKRRMRSKKPKKQQTRLL